LFTVIVRAVLVLLTEALEIVSSPPFVARNHWFPPEDAVQVGLLFSVPALVGTGITMPAVGAGVRTLLLTVPTTIIGSAVTVIVTGIVIVFTPLGFAGEAFALGAIVIVPEYDPATTLSVLGLTV
jgi:hypothetical protein